MRRIKLAWIFLVLLFAGEALGQVSLDNVLPFKDMVFPQVAAGGAYQSWITVTNRGTEVWKGDLEFRGGAGVPWNPVVNGTAIVGGTLFISVNPGATNTYKVTSPGSTEAGYAMVLARDANLTSFLEGHLTYYVSDGNLVIDSVGVPPARQFLVSSLPFEDFNSICLAFANSDSAGRPAHLKLKVLSDTNAQVGQTKDLPLARREHMAQYLWQLLPGIALGRGRLEIESDVPVSGIALTQAPGNQFSSLPLESTTRTYVLEWMGGHPNIFDHMTLWTESFLVKGYVELVNAEGGDLYAVSGQIADGKLHLHFDGYWQVYEYFGYIRSDGVFTLGQQSFTGTWYTAWPAAVGFETGTFVATLVSR